MPQFANGGIVDFDYGILSQGSDYDSTKIHNPTVCKPWDYGFQYCHNPTVSMNTMKKMSDSQQ